MPDCGTGSTSVTMNFSERELAAAREDFERAAARLRAMERSLGIEEEEEDIDTRAVDGFIQYVLGLNDSDLLCGSLLKPPSCKQLFGGIEAENGIFVRKAYVDLYNAIRSLAMNSSEISRTARFLVLGSPGVGKSVFGIFVVMKLLREKENIVLRPLGAQNRTFLTFRNDKYNVSMKPHKNCTYAALFDGKEQDTDGTYLSHIKWKMLFASPARQNYNVFKKKFCKFYCINQWSVKELGVFAKAAGLGHEWEDKFKVVGGVPEYLFSDESCDSLLEILHEALPTTLEGLHDLIDGLQVIVGSIPDHQQAMHLLVNYFSLTMNGERKCIEMDFASTIVESLIQTRFHFQLVSELRQLLRTPDLTLQSWRGQNIQSLLLGDFAAMPFKLKTLEAPLAAEIVYTHEPFQATMIQSIDGINSDRSGLYIPSSKTYPSIDAILVDKGNVLYLQCSVSERHPVKYNHLKRIYDSMNIKFFGYTHRLVFLVSNDVYDGFKAQSYLNEDRKARKTALDIPLKQYVARIMHENR